MEALTFQTGCLSTLTFLIENMIVIIAFPCVHGNGENETQSPIHFMTTL